VTAAENPRQDRQTLARENVRLWIPPLFVVALYPELIYSFAWALRTYTQSGNRLLALYALIAMLLAASVPPLTARALLAMRHDEQPVFARGLLYVAFAVSSLFSLTYTLSRMVGLGQQYHLLGAIWASAWMAVGAAAYFRREVAVPRAPGNAVKWLRGTHGTVALCLLCGFLIAHLLNHDVALWGVQQHQAVMRWLRLWYRSEWVEPVLLGLFVAMIGTGIPMAAYYSRRRMDAFRVVQVATGVYIGVFVCSHVLATLLARRRGVETDWFFAAGPASLLDGSLLARLIPHYFYGVLCLCVHVACGLRVVLLQHGVSKIISNRVAYALAGVGLVVAVLASAALLGVRFESIG
jgi:succinate dehydrogenase/fumarate reductase cytochrome b subunit